MSVRPAVIPAIRYENAVGAIDFLVKAFGFERHAVYADPADASVIHHAQLVRDGCMIMLGSARNDASAAKYKWKLPREAGGVTMSLCVVVDDPDAHHARAVAAGAEILTAPYDNEGYPGRSYNAADSEGHPWNFTNYDPWSA